VANMSDWLERNLASHIFGSGTLSKPSVIAIALTKNTPDDTDTGASSKELANSGAYARQSLNPSATNWTDPVGVGGVCYNLSVLTFPTATANWGWVSGVLICDSATYGAGNAWAHGSLSTPKNIDINDRLEIPVSGIAVTFA